MDWFEVVFSEQTIEWLLSKGGAAIQSRVSENLFVLGIVWWFMRKQVSSTFTGFRTEFESFKAELQTIKAQFSKHMESVEKGLTNITNGLSDVRKSFESLEQSHSQRLSGLEVGVKDLSDRVGKLEQKN